MTRPGRGDADRLLIAGGEEELAHRGHRIVARTTPAGWVGCRARGVTRRDRAGRPRTLAGKTPAPLDLDRPARHLHGLRLVAVDATVRIVATPPMTSPTTTSAAAPASPIALPNPPLAVRWTWLCSPMDSSVWKRKVVVRIDRIGGEHDVQVAWVVSAR